MSSTFDRAELRRLLDEATPGPWEAEGSQIWGPDRVLVAAVREYSTLADRPDALIVAAAVNALPGLLEQIERVRQLHIHGDEWCDFHESVWCECADAYCEECGASWPCPPHGWRCEDKTRYPGPCGHDGDMAREVMAVLGDILPDLLTKAWDEGRRIGLMQADWEYGHRLTMPNLTNPYRQGADQ